MGALPLPDKPSIAVLPFANMSGDPEQEYFADGMVEEIITARSRIRWLFVIARNSSFTYKARTVDVKQVGRELGVCYVLEGSVRKPGGRVRITAQLIDAITGTHLWADRFDGSLEDVFDLQERVAVNVAGTIEPALQVAEMRRAGLPVMVSPSGLLPQVDRIAGHHPELKLVIDHLALLRAKDDLPRLLHLARLPNAAVKASALPAYSSHDYPYYSLYPCLRRVFDAFGPRRIFWGTDLTRLPCSYRQAITLFTEELPWLSADNQEWVMGRGICDWLGWPPPG